MTPVRRRQLLTAAAGTFSLAALSACSRSTTSSSAATGSSAATDGTPSSPGQKVVTARLTARATTLDLGGPTVATWAYGDAVPGPLIRATAGDRIRVTVDNQLPTSTSIHWHGIALKQAMDGVPGVTQSPIEPGGSFTYDFTAPDPGTYFYHPHSGPQLDRGLYGRLIIDDPKDPGRYDAEWIVVLDDWLDGTGRTPDQVLTQLSGPSTSPGSTISPTAGGSTDLNGMEGMAGMGGMDGMGGMGGMAETAQSAVLGGAGDVTYPHYLLNGRIPAAAATFAAKPGHKIRIRIINAASDTAFRVALGGHRLTVTHTDGYPVTPRTTDTLIIAMGERFDVEVTLADGAFPLVAAAEGKTGLARGVVRTGSGTVPGADSRPAELGRSVLLGNDLAPAESSRLPAKDIQRTHGLALAGSMSPYRWTINSRSFPDTQTLDVRSGERVRLTLTNHSMMFHPMHLHGHTFALTGSGLRKDTVIVRPMQTVGIDLDANNPGTWMLHCHNIYHAERGMMTTLRYR